MSTKGKASSVISSPGTVSRSNHSTRDHMELERSEEQGTIHLQCIKVTLFVHVYIHVHVDVRVYTY